MIKPCFKFMTSLKQIDRRQLIWWRYIRYGSKESRTAQLMVKIFVSKSGCRVSASLSSFTQRFRIPSTCSRSRLTESIPDAADPSTSCCNWLLLDRDDSIPVELVIASWQRRMLYSHTCRSMTKKYLFVRNERNGVLACRSIRNQLQMQIFLMCLEAPPRQQVMYASCIMHRTYPSKPSVWHSDLYGGVYL